MLRKVIISYVAMAVVIMAVAVVSAHMTLNESVPHEGETLISSPHRIELRFSQEPDPVVSNLTLKGISGLVEIGQTKVIAAERSIVADLPVLDAGKYTVNWRAAGDDGHVQRGEFSFVIQAN